MKVCICICFCNMSNIRDKFTALSLSLYVGFDSNYSTVLVRKLIIKLERKQFLVWGNFICGHKTADTKELHKKYRKVFTASFNKKIAVLKEAFFLILKAFLYCLETISFYFLVDVLFLSFVNCFLTCYNECSL